MEQVRFITDWFGRYDGRSIDDYIGLGGFSTVRGLAERGIEDTVAIIADSGLQGRGGAAYPTGRKLKQAREALGERKFVVCNADEGEPGTFKDRELLKQNIYQVLEGMIIAGICSEAQEGILYVREEYTWLHDTLREAIRQCHERGVLGENLLGTGYTFDVRVFSGAGAYVCGEGFALCESLEGKPGRPRTKPPFVKQAGFLRLPTLVINTETLSTIVSILRKGADAFKSYGTEVSTGTKVISISGKVNRPGVYEIPFGLTIREIIDGYGGGMKDGAKGHFVQVGGASGGLLPERLWDTRYTYEDLEGVGLSIGSGALVVADESNDVRGYLKVIGEFFRHESCGKCTPCREGNRQLRFVLDNLAEGSADADDLMRYDAIMGVMKGGSLCGSGKTEVVPFLTARKYFPEAFQLKADSPASTVGA